MKQVKRNYRLPLNLQTFSEPDTNEPPANPEPKTVTMTQEELDALIARSKGQVKRQYADYDDLKSKLSEFEKAEEERRLAAMSEHERIQAELDAAKKAAEDAEKARTQVLEIANQRAIKAEFKLAAAGANILTDALEDAYILVDKTGISVDENGNVVGVREAIEALVASKPYLVGVKQPQNPKEIGEGTASFNRGGNSNITPAQFRQMSYTERAALHEKDAALYLKLIKQS